jgi:hypothetical protein
VDQDRRTFEQHELLAARARLLRRPFSHAGTKTRGGQYDSNFHGELRFYRGFFRPKIGHWLGIALARRPVVPLGPGGGVHALIELSENHFSGGGL